MEVDWEAIRVIFAAISAAGGATNVARWFAERVQEIPEDKLPELQADAISKINRARAKAMASPLPPAAQNIPISSLAIFNDFKAEVDKIRDSISDTIRAKGTRPAERRAQLLVLNRDYCTTIASIIDNVPEACITSEIKVEWSECQARFPDL